MKKLLLQSLEQEKKTRRLNFLLKILAKKEDIWLLALFMIIGLLAEQANKNYYTNSLLRKGEQFRSVRLTIPSISTVFSRRLSGI